ncbi:hypothetical protein [Sphingomonas sp.]|uniref:hypothetical protein n=1 Tax=Sphingomonas sp. TaxID=28214 RepID=UPI003CC55B65
MSSRKSAPSRPGPTTLLFGLATFVAGTAALTIAAVALATRRRDEAEKGQSAPAPLPLRPEPAANGPAARDPGVPTGLEGHGAPDLAAGGDLGPDHRAPAAFRPDIDAPMTPAEREALRPATGPAPSLVSAEGTGFQPGGER